MPIERRAGATPGPPPPVSGDGARHRAATSPPLSTIGAIDSSPPGPARTRRAAIAARGRDGDAAQATLPVCRRAGPVSPNPSPLGRLPAVSAAPRAFSASIATLSGGRTRAGAPTYLSATG